MRKDAYEGSQLRMRRGCLKNLHWSVPAPVRPFGPIAFNRLGRDYDGGWRVCTMRLAGFSSSIVFSALWRAYGVSAPLGEAMPRPRGQPDA
jgi:hypothetical protein